MPNLSNVIALHEGSNVRVKGTKGSSVIVRAYVNPNLEAFPTNEALFDGFDSVTTPKAQDTSNGVNFELIISVVGIGLPLRCKVVSSDGKADSPPVIENTPVPVDPGIPVSSSSI